MSQAWGIDRGMNASHKTATANGECRDSVAPESGIFTRYQHYAPDPAFLKAIVCKFPLALPEYER